MSEQSGGDDAESVLSSVQAVATGGPPLLSSVRFDTLIERRQARRRAAPRTARQGVAFLRRRQGRGHGSPRRFLARILLPRRADPSQPRGPVSYTHLRAHETDSY